MDNTLSEKIAKGLRCCMPWNDKDAKLSCSVCPYKESCFDSLATMTLPVAMIQDIRKLVGVKS